MLRQLLFTLLLAASVLQAQLPLLAGLLAGQVGVGTGVYCLSYSTDAQDKKPSHGFPICPICIAIQLAAASLPIYAPVVFLVLTAFLMWRVRFTKLAPPQTLVYQTAARAPPKP